MASIQKYRFSFRNSHIALFQCDLCKEFRRVEFPTYSSAQVTLGIVSPGGLITIKGLSPLKAFLLGHGPAQPGSSRAGLYMGCLQWP